MDCPYAPNFLVVNLASQADAVASYVRGWSQEQILHWLSRQGELQMWVNAAGEEVYSFRSRMGFETMFLLEEDRFTFLGDHFKWSPER
jgi:hypothetical protein